MTNAPNTSAYQLRHELNTGGLSSGSEFIRIMLVETEVRSKKLEVRMRAWTQLAQFETLNQKY